MMKQLAKLNLNIKRLKQDAAGSGIDNKFKAPASLWPAVIELTKNGVLLVCPKIF